VTTFTPPGACIPAPDDRAWPGGPAKRRTAIKRVHGNVTGLKANQIRRLEHVYRRKVPAHQIVTQELGRYLCELSQEINRQVGVLIDRIRPQDEAVSEFTDLASFSPFAVQFRYEPVPQGAAPIDRPAAIRQAEALRQRLWSLLREVQ
jgi:hypothetical protein